MAGKAASAQRKTLVTAGSVTRRMGTQLWGTHAPHPISKLINYTPTGLLLGGRLLLAAHQPPLPGGRDVAYILAHMLPKLNTAEYTSRNSKAVPCNSEGGSTQEESSGGTQDYFKNRTEQPLPDLRTSLSTIPNMHFYKRRYSGKQGKLQNCRT